MDWGKLGLKVGLEVHQQLKSSKLFCACPSLLRQDPPDLKLERKHRPVASEVGTLDPAALHEFLKGKAYLYEAYRDTTCLVELDEEPPHKLNLEALKIVIEVAKGLGAQPFGELHIMRKAIIDGSCPSGFQRTLLVAGDGSLPFGGKQIRIETIALEEDAARIISKSNKITVFRLDRLGIPLIEITTSPDMATPDEAKAGAEAIGLLLRSTGKVMRGLGTIRQDLNVSIKGGERIELKGVQRLDLIPDMVRNEVARQQALISLAKQLKGKDKDFETSIRDVTDIFQSTACRILKPPIYAVRIPNFAGILKLPLHAGRHFGKEVADYVRVKAGVRGFFHTDEMPAYGVSAEEVGLLRSRLEAGPRDLVAFVSASKEQARTALAVVVDRCKMAFNGVPKETRQAREDGSSSFLRPLGGAARMYPETDLLPIVLPEHFVSKIKPPQPVEKKLEKLERLGLNRTLAKAILLSERSRVFHHAVKAGVRPTLAASILEETLPYLRREGLDIASISDSSLREMFEMLARGKLTKEVVPDAIALLARNMPLNTLASEKLTEDELRRELKKLIGENEGYIESKGKYAISGLMGMAMKRFKGKAEGQTISRLLKEELSL